MAARSVRSLVLLLLGGLCAVLVGSGWGGPAAAVPARAAVGDQVLDILVLGDSYSAGNGATDDQGAVQTYGPDGCRRSRVNWSEKYAAALRQQGQQVRLVNHACSGGVTADITAPRVMDTASKVVATPAGVTTSVEADAYLARTDPCNTRRFPDEEFWTYRTTSVNPLLLGYDCTRNLRPQADFVTPDVDLLLFTMGGNDAGFSAIVQSCFVPLLRTSSGCQGKVDAARAALPQIRQRLLAGIAAIRAHGLGDDARMVQLGYPWLQVDNNFTLPDGGYAAGDQVRSLVSQGNAAIGAIVPEANAGHPGQLTFLTGVPEKFSGHEPDAATPIGNPDRWVNQVGDGDAIEVWYHPNRLGHSAYADLLTARGTFGAPTGPPATTSPVRASLRLRFLPRQVQRGDRVALRVRVRLSDGSRPRGRVVVRALPGRAKLASTVVRKAGGRARVVFRVPRGRVTKVQVTYRDKVAPVVRRTHRVR